MPRPILRALSLAAGLALVAGCQDQKVMVVEQAQAGSVSAAGVPVRPAAPMPARPRGAAQCAPPAGSGPFTPMGRPVSTQDIPKPPRALAEHVNGCAGVRFRIGPDGASQDVEVMAEYPAGYGFGKTVRQMIEASRWAPRDDLSWHYLNATIRVPRNS